MSEIVTYTNCPVCHQANFAKHLSVKDYTVSNEIFEIVKCNICSLAFTQNIPTENTIGKYYKSETYISHSDTQKGFISKVYHKVRNLTLVSKQKLLSKNCNTNNGNLLDIGAGTGAFSNTMKTSGWNVVGLEPDDEAKIVAKNKYNLELQPTQNLFSLSSNNFDAITMWHVLEHVHTLQDYMQQFGKVLNTKGKLFIAVPNYTSYDSQYYKEHWAGYDVPRHLYHFNPQAMGVLANKNNFNIVAIKPMWFDSTYVAMLSEKYKNGKGNILMAIVIGLISNIKTLFNTKNCSSLIYILEKK